MRRRHDTAAQRERHRLGTLRRLWRAVEDFSPSGWGHEQLSKLALLAANVEDESPPSWRAVEGLAWRTAAARLAAIERLGDVAIELERCGRREDALRLGRLTTRIDRSLAEVSARLGHGEAFAEPATELARACREALSSIADVRRGLIGRVAVDLPPLLRWLDEERFAAASRAGALAVDVAGLGGKDRPWIVLAGVLDLADGIASALGVLLECPRRRAAGVTLAARPCPDSVMLRFDWSGGAADGEPLPAVLSALLPLEAYGAVLRKLEPRAPGAGGVAAELRLAASGARRQPVRLVPTRAVR
jgi:hypothetical protein